MSNPITTKDASRSSQAARARTSDGFRPFYVTSLVRESARVLSVHLVPCDGTAPPPWRPGQCVQVWLRDSDGDVVRSYSISGTDGQGCGSL